MNARRRKCYVCGLDLTSKQISREMYKGQVRICCVGKCADTVRALFRKEKARETV